MRPKAPSASLVVFFCAASARNSPCTPQISGIYPKEIPNEFSSFRFDENRVLAKPLDVTTGLSEVDPLYCGP
jgi:hypothetical protein